MEAIIMQEKVIKNGKAQELYTVASQWQGHSKVLSSWKRGQEIPVVSDRSTACMCTHPAWMHLPELCCSTSNFWVPECPTNQEVPETLGPRQLNMQMLIPIVPSDMVPSEKYNDREGGAVHPDTSWWTRGLPLRRPEQFYTSESVSR